MYPDGKDLDSTTSPRRPWVVKTSDQPGTEGVRTTGMGTRGVPECPDRSGVGRQDRTGFRAETKQTLTTV